MVAKVYSESLQNCPPTRLMVRTIIILKKWFTTAMASENSLTTSIWIN